MSGAQVVEAPTNPIERATTRIEAHLVRLGHGHDPFGHLFAIERLARSARADLWESQRRAALGQDKG